MRAFLAAVAGEGFSRAAIPHPDNGAKALYAA